MCVWGACQQAGGQARQPWGCRMSAALCCTSSPPPPFPPTSAQCWLSLQGRLNVENLLRLVLDPCEGVVCVSPGLCELAPGVCKAGKCYYSAAPAGAKCTGGTCNGNKQCGKPALPLPLASTVVPALKSHQLAPGAACALSCLVSWLLVRGEAEQHNAFSPAVNTPEPTVPYVIKPCPGAPSGVTCRPGIDSLSGLPEGCCACRKTKAGGVTLLWGWAQLFAYYGYGPSCSSAPLQLPPGTQVDYTGAKWMDYHDLGCAKGDYVEIMVQASARGPRHWCRPALCTAQSWLLRRHRECCRRVVAVCACVCGVAAFGSSWCCNPTMTLLVAFLGSWRMRGILPGSHGSPTGLCPTTWPSAMLGGPAAQRQS